MKPNPWRGWLAVACEALGVTALLLAVLLGYANRAVFDSEGFARRLSASLSEPGVANFVAAKIADGVVAAKPDLTGLRPLIIAGGRTVVGSPPFRAAARRAALEAHRSLMSGTGQKIMLTVKDVGEILQAALAEHPQLASKLPRKLSARLAALDELPAGELAGRVVRLAHRLRLSAILLLFGGLGLIAAGIALSRDHRRTVFRVGITCAAAAVVLWAVSRFGGPLLAGFASNQDMGLLASGLWRAFVGDLRLWALALGLSGLAVASASASLVRADAGKQQVVVALWHFATAPAERGRRFLRGTLLLLIGVAAVLHPIAMLYLVAVLAGVVGAYFGLRECFNVLLRAIPEDAARFEKTAGASFGAGRIVLAGVLVLAIAGGVTYWVLRTPAGPSGAAVITACNGFPELCDKRLDQVVFPTTHNSMGGADNPRWLFPNQSKSIPGQLQDGIRALLIDLHYGMPVGDKVKTILDDEKAAMAKYEAALGKEGMAAALRIRDRLVGGDEKQRDVYMGHGFCELGATPFTEALGEIRDFLVANPGEILVIVIQDEGVTPQDVAKCFEKSGLIDFVYRGPAGPWPTLRQMAESDQRVVVFAENNAAGVPWYHQAFEVIQETPYTFHDPSQFSERPNRGGTSGSLLMMNHWIETAPMPKPSNAKIVNAYDFLLKRALRCQRTRHHVVNFVAVDLYGEGDLMKVCQKLNGIRR
jgi:hypothetical protein